MGRFAALVGKRVEAHYRAGDIQLSAIGTAVSDTGESLILEDRFSQNGKKKTMRVEIPYQYVVRVVESHEKPAPPTAAHVPAKKRR